MHMCYKALLVLWFPILAAGADSQRYILELSGDSIAEHMAKERRRTARPVEMDSDVVRTGQTQLRSEQRQARKTLEDLGVKVLDSTETISNALIVDMPDELADAVAALPGVKRVQKARTFKPTLDHAVVLHKVPQAWNRIGVDKAGLGMKIAIIDSGIEISHPGMQDSTLRLPDGFPKMNADSDAAFTNSKVIVARSYARLFSTLEDDLSARDLVGHGTATAMAAAGALNTGPLGPLQGVVGSSCSWNEQDVVCATDSKIQVWQFAA